MTRAIDQPFWDGLDEGQLHLPGCAECGRWTWPPQERCGPCGCWDMIWKEVAMEGLVHSFTWVRHPFSPTMTGLTPFPNVLVELPQAGGARLLGVLEGVAEGLAIGAPVVGRITPDNENHAVLRWRLAP